MQTVTLTCHPTTPCEAVGHISAHIKTSPAGALTLKYSLEGDVGHLRIPADGVPRHADTLWQHTCFEAFVAAREVAAYYEFNFAPSGEWAMYRFGAYREGMIVVEAAQTSISARRDTQRLVLQAVVDLKELGDFWDRAELRLALAAVIEENNGRLSYWALAHPSTKPDFHHADSFTLTLDHRRRLA